MLWFIFMNFFDWWLVLKVRSSEMQVGGVMGDLIKNTIKTTIGVVSFNDVDDWESVADALQQEWEGLPVVSRPGCLAVGRTKSGGVLYEELRRRGIPCVTLDALSGAMLMGREFGDDWHNQRI